MAASRRALVVGIALALLAAPLAGEAQPRAVPRIGLLESGSLTGRAPMWEAFRQAMRELGYVEGRTVTFEARGAGGGGKELPALAAELVRLEVDVIVTSGSAAARAARQATGTIPIVMASGNPLQLGLVTSLARPGGNVTGIQTLSVALSGKRVEMAREVVPGASRLAILGSRGGPRASPPSRRRRRRPRRSACASMPSPWGVRRSSTGPSRRSRGSVPPSSS
jgi:putative ABC transport system substrate-binding protein